MKLHRTKTLAAIAVAGVATLTLGSCAGGNADSGGDGETVTITFSATTFGEAGRGEKLAAWIDEFNASQDAVRVEPASVPYPTYAQTILTQMAGGVGPDLIRFDMPDYMAAQAAGLVAPVDDLVDASQYDLIEGPDKFMVVDGKRYGFMFEISNYALIYNTTLVPAPPTDFDEFLDIAKKTTSGDVYGLAFRHTLPEESGTWVDMWNYVYGFGGQWSDGENLTINAPENLEGLEKFQEVYDAKVIPQGAGAAVYRPMFAENTVGMMIDNGAVPGIELGMNDSLKLAAAPIPFPVASQGAIMGPIVLNGASDNADAAAVFLKWMLEKKNQESLQAVLGASSVATKTDRTATQLVQAPWLQVYDSLTETGLPHVVLGFEAKTPDIRKIVVDQVLRALAGEQDMQTALDTAQELAEQAVGG